MTDFRTASAIAATALNGIGISPSAAADPSGAAESLRFEQTMQKYFSKLSATSTNAVEKPFVPVAPGEMVNVLFHLPRL